MLTDVQLSVIIPVRDAAWCVEKLLISLRTNLSVPHELIIVDNGSRDNTMDVVLPYADKVIISDGGVGDCRHRGALASKGTLLLFLDADHQLLPGTIESAMDIMRLTSADAIVIPERPARQTGRLVDRLIFHERRLTEAAGLGIPRFFRRSVYLEIAGLSSGVVFGEDWRLRSSSHFVKLSEVPLLHSEPLTLRALLYKYLKYGLRTALIGGSNSKDLGMKERFRRFTALLMDLSLRQSLIILPVLAIKVAKTAAFAFGYCSGRSAFYMRRWCKK